MIKSIINVEELENNLSNPEIIIVDCRFDLNNEKWGFQDYSESHIPGAFYADLNQDLSSPITKDSGRHPLPDEDKFVKFLSSMGIDENKTVVLYDTSFGSFAARLWWLLRSYGHKKIFLLNGGFQAWIEKGKPTDAIIPSPKASEFVGTFSNIFLSDQKEIEQIIGDPNFILIDARSPLRYSGQEEPIDTIAGHIPGAINVFHQNNLDQKGYLLSEKKLRDLYAFLSGFDNQENIILYCGSGVTSCYNLIALSQIGINRARLYAGSWSEWIRNPLHPIIQSNK